MANQNNKIMTPVFRVGFPRVFTPESMENGPPKYSLVCLFPADADLTELKGAVKAAAVAEWGTDIPKGLKLPFRDSGDKSQHDGFEEGCVNVTPKTKYKPGLIDGNRQDIIDETDFYGGCYARCTVRAYAYSHPTGGKGVALSLENIQKVKDGESFGNRTDAAEDFDALPQGDAAAPAADESDPFFD